MLLGCNPSHPAKLARRVSIALHEAVAPFLAGSAMPSSVDLSSFEPRRFSQRKGSCVGHSGAGCLVTAFGAAGKSLPWVPSPRIIWTVPRAKERALSAHPTARLQDVGVEIADAIAGYAEYGLQPMGPTDGMQNTDVLDSNYQDELNAGGLIVGAERPVVGPYGVEPSAGDVIDAVLAALIPVQIGFFADSVFDGLKPGDIMGAPNLADPTGGGHAVYLGGFDTLKAPAKDTNGVVLPAGTRIRRLTNSWDEGWCDLGRCWVGPNFMNLAYEAHPYAVGGAS